MKKILLIDDYQQIRNLYKELLIKKGYTVDTESDGEKGCARAKQEAYDLILIDLVMPKMSGIEVIDCIRNNPEKSRNAKLITLSTIGENQLVNQAIERGAFDNIIKSTVNSDEIVANIETIFSKLP